MSKRDCYIIHPHEGIKTLYFYAHVGGWYPATGNLTIDLQQWHHYAGTFDGQTIRLYVDGEEVANQSAAGKINWDPGECWIGQDDSVGTVHHFDGQIAEVRIWDKCRSQTEIRQDMNRRLSGDEVGLVGYWTLGEGTGETAYDHTKESHHGTIIGGTWETAELPIPPVNQPRTPLWLPSEQDDMTAESQSTLQFNGTNTYVAIPDAPSLQIANYTLEAWIKPQGVPNEEWNGLMGKTGRNFNIWLNQQCYIQHSFHNAASTWTNFSCAPGTINLDQWNHVTITNDGQTATTYVNGIQVAFKLNSDLGGPPIVDADTIYMGCNLDAPSDCFFKGAIAEVRLWDHTRTLTEIRQDMYHSLTGNETGLVGYWPLDDGEGEQASDRTKNGNHGTIYNGGWELDTVPLEEDMVAATAFVTT